MRIISGKHKGRTIDVPRNFNGRPTTDFARESLFNILHHLMEMDGAKVLDLFAGSGAVSLECWSRGASLVLAIEQSPVHVKGIQKNFDTFEVDGGSVFRGDVFMFLKKHTFKYHFIFADPPYDLEALIRLPDLVFKADLLEDMGWFVLEHPEKMDFSAVPGFVQLRKYGSVNFSFFQKK